MTSLFAHVWHPLSTNNRCNKEALAVIFVFFLLSSVEMNVYVTYRAQTFLLFFRKLVISSVPMHFFLLFNFNFNPCKHFYKMKVLPQFEHEFSIKQANPIFFNWIINTLKCHCGSLLVTFCLLFLFDCVCCCCHCCVVVVPAAAVVVVVVLMRSCTFKEIHVTYFWILTICLWSIPVDAHHLDMILHLQQSGQIAEFGSQTVLANNCQIWQYYP